MAASTITRTALVHDTGTPAAPVGDGTLWNNTWLTGLYNAIDNLYTTAFTFGSRLTVDGFGTSAFSAAGTGGNILSVRNVTAGTGNYGQLRVGNDTSDFVTVLNALSSTWTTNAYNVQGGSALSGEGVGGLSIVANHAAGVLRFYAGGGQERARVDTAGNFFVGTITAAPSSARREQIVGTGEATNVTDAGNKTATLLVASSTANVGDGGAIEFGFNHGTSAQSYFGAIKGLGTDSASNTTGVLGVFLRRAASNTGLSEVARFSPTPTGGVLLMNSTGNVNMTSGVTVDQAAALDQVVAFKGGGGNINHGMITLVETDTFAAMAKADTGGGLKITGYAAGVLGLQLDAAVTGAVIATGISTSTIAPIIFNASLKSGTTTVSMGSNNMLAVIQDFGTTRFGFDSDGDSHQDVGTAWTNYDQHDDLALLNMLSAHVTRPDDPLKTQFVEWLAQSRAPLERLKLVSFNDGPDQDGHAFVNMSKLTMLLTGAVRQLGETVHGDFARRLAALEQKGLVA